MSLLSPACPITTLVRSTPSSVKIRTAVRPVWCGPEVCTVMGAPVSTWVRAMARAMRSTPGDGSGVSRANLRKAALTPVSAMPSVMSRLKSVTIGSGMSIRLPGPR